MYNFYEKVDRFFTSVEKYFSYNEIFMLAIGLFIFAAVCVIISTSHSYEAKLIKAIDMFNNYFIDNPNINEDNLVAFNARMKLNKVPKQLRKQWQQFVLYREGKASTYMSFENCVSTPIKNSTFKRDIVTLNIISYILAVASFLMNLYGSYEAALGELLAHTLMVPILVLLLNYLVTIFLDLRHNAIVSDLNSNYQYFEVNIDKATQTLPEYVDYEVLFDKNEIKKGIPILYAYLQKRAEEEQRELERARLRNVEHEKFNFDESGIESSLVLDRAMQEAENYMAERKKYMQDMQQINSELSQEESDFREITKEYQRQMQVSKESFENYKTQLAEASSTIEANYLKKQQQQELDRQRNLERDYDTASDKHKKIVETFQNELSTIEGFIKEARKNLERSMMSEFETYSNKVYDAAHKLVEEREEEKTENLKNKIQSLEEELAAKNSEIEQLYSENQTLLEKTNEVANSYQAVEPVYEPQNIETYENEVPEQTYQEEPVYETPVEEVEQTESFNYNPYAQEETEQAEDEFNYNPYAQEEAETEAFDYDPYAQEEVEQSNVEEFSYNPYGAEEAEIESNEEPISFNYDPYAQEEANEEPETFEQDVAETPVEEETSEEDSVGEFDYNSLLPNMEEIDKLIKQNSTDEDPEEDEGALKLEVSTKQENESTTPKRKAGRPRKEVTEEKPKASRGRGRPRKEKVEEKPKASRGRGRPRKEETEVKSPVKAGRGRPRKAKAEEVALVTKGRGRPRKEKVEEKPLVKKGRGRPRKAAVEQVKTATKKGRGRPRKDTETVELKKLVTDIESVKNLEEIEGYLREISEEIAKEEAKKSAAEKALEKGTRISKKK